MKSNQNKLIFKKLKTHKTNLNNNEYFALLIPIVFLKIINLIFEKAYQEETREHYKEDIISYNCKNILFVPKQSRWNHLLTIKNPETIKKAVSQAFVDLMNASEANQGWLKNLEFKDVFEQKKYQGTNLIKLLQLLDRELTINSEEDEAINLTNIIGFFDDLLKDFVQLTNKKTNKLSDSLVNLLIYLLKPFKGKFYDPCFGLGKTFLQIFKQLPISKDDQEKNSKIRFYGQEKKAINWKFTKMNLLLNHIDNSHLGKEANCTFLYDQHDRLNEKFDYIIALPPSSLKNYWSEKLISDERWKYGLPPKKNANYAWIQHVISKLKEDGIAAIALSNGSLRNDKSKDIRTKLLQANLIDAIITLPSHLIYSEASTCCIWIFKKNRQNKQVLFINASYDKFGTVKKTLRSLDEKDLIKLSDIYQNFTKNPQTLQHEWARTISTQEIIANNSSLVPGEYVPFVDYEYHGVDLKEALDKARNELEKLYLQKKTYEKQLFKKK